MIIPILPKSRRETHRGVVTQQRGGAVEILLTKDPGHILWFGVFHLLKQSTLGAVAHAAFSGTGRKHPEPSFCFTSSTFWIPSDPIPVELSLSLLALSLQFSLILTL